MIISERGLSEEEALRRLKEVGPNSLPSQKRDSLFLIFFRQLQSPLIYTLFGASLVMFFLGETIDGAIIIVTLLFDSVVGTFQEGKAQKTLLALKNLVETTATVLRSGKEVIIPDSRVAPGDIIILHEGDKTPADARVLVSHNLTLDEASMTGESTPVHKMAENPKANMVFKGTHTVAGHGKAVVVATGLNTVIGQIAQKTAAIDTEIPLKADVRFLSRLVIMGVALISSFIFGSGVLLGHSAEEMFTIAVSLSVSIIPEGLPVVLTLVLAMGVWRMSKRNALVKNLNAVEALGQATVIAVDKTGTVTKNELMVKKVFANDTMFDIAGSGYEPAPPISRPELLTAGKIAAFCSGAHVVYDQNTGEYRIAGDPTEAALLVFAQKAGLQKDDLENEFPLTFEIPFDYKTKYHLTAHREQNGQFVGIVGAPEVILDACALPGDERKKLEEVFTNMSKEGLRVVAAAAKHEASGARQLEKREGYTFAAFLGMSDSIRREVRQAVRLSEQAGARVVMITGDIAATAQEVAKEAGIFRKGDKVLTGGEIDRLSDKELAKIIGKVSVFARVTPEHKLKIINAYRLRGHVVAMTGDGVNDAPSLVAADLGVAMGKIGSEVAKEAADIVLLDDNFGSIVAAIEEGRSIYKTIQKVILYLFSTSAGEVLTIAGALFLGWPLPLVAAQIIWLNLVTDGLLDVALAIEPKEDGVINGKFSRPGKYLLDANMARRMIIMALPMMIGTLALYSRYLATDAAKAQTVALTVLAAFQWFNAWNCRSETKSIFRMNPLSNPFLVATTAITIALHALAVYHPFLQSVLRTNPLAFNDWLIITVVASSIFAVEEVRKFFYRGRIALS